MSRMVPGTRCRKPARRTCRSVRRQTRGRTRYSWQAGCIATLLCLGGTTAQAETKNDSYAVVFGFSGYTWSQDSKRAFIRLDFEFECFEWVNEKNERALEGGTGRGTATVLGKDGQVEKTVPMSVRYLRYSAPALSTNNYQTTWSLRGEMYVQADGHPTPEEFEVGPVGRVPHEGEFTYPPIELPPSGPAGRRFMMEQSGKLADRGHGGSIISYRVVGDQFGAEKQTSDVVYGVIKLVKVKRRKLDLSPGARDAERLLARVGYLRADYPIAVAEEGLEILNESEYQEQLSMSRDARELARRLDVPKSVLDQLSELASLVSGPARPSIVAKKCDEIEKALLDTLWLTLRPPKPASLAEAKRLFKESCALCHGEDGLAQTPKAKELNPPPASFADPETTALLSPYRAFATITDGVVGTGMASWAAYSPEQRWALAFYVFSFRHAGGKDRELPVSPALEDMAAMNDNQLTDWASARGLGPKDVSAIRLAGWQRAAESPLLRVREEVRAAAAGGEEAEVHLAAARAHLSEASPLLAMQGALDGVHGQLRALDLAHRTGEDTQIRDATLAALAELRMADVAIAGPPPSGSAAVLGAVRGLGGSALLPFLALLSLFAIARREMVWVCLVGGVAGIVWHFIGWVPIPASWCVIGALLAGMVWSFTRGSKVLSHVWLVPAALSAAGLCSRITNTIAPWLSARGNIAVCGIVALALVLCVGVVAVMVVGRLGRSLQRRRAHA